MWSRWQLRQSIDDEPCLTHEEKSFVYQSAQLRTGMVSISERYKATFTNFLHRLCQHHSEIVLDDEDTPCCRTHLRMYLPSPFSRDQVLFATPWRLTANIKLDGSAVENPNVRNRAGSGESPMYHMPILLLGEENEEDDEGSPAGASSPQDAYAYEGSAQAEGGGEDAVVRVVRVVRFHVTPRKWRDGQVLNSDGTPSTWVTPTPYNGRSYLPHQTFEFSADHIYQCGYASGYSCLGP